MASTGAAATSVAVGWPAGVSSLVESKCAWSCMGVSIQRKQT